VKLRSARGFGYHPATMHRRRRPRGLERGALRAVTAALACALACAAALDPSRARAQPPGPAPTTAPPVQPAAGTPEDETAAPAPGPTSGAASPQQADAENTSAAPEPASSIDPADAAASEAPPAERGPTREALLQAAIVDAERDQPSLLLPSIAVGISVATLVAGTLVGAIHVATCDGSCSTGAIWPWLVIGGCTLTTASSAWLLIAAHDESEARHRLERARRELERDRIDRAPRALAPPALTLRASF
jgi:hypothetical protein